MTVFKSVAVRINRYSYSRYIGKLCLDCTNAFVWSGTVMKSSVTFPRHFMILWNDLPDLAVAFYCVDIKLPDRLYSLGG